MTHSADLTRENKSQKEKGHHKVKRSRVREVLAQDANDIYNRFLCWLIWPSLAFYAIFTIFNSHTDVTAVDADANTLLISIARDSGLRMSMKKFPPSLLLGLHWCSGLALFIAVVLQKHTVLKMFRSSFSRFSLLHRKLGYLIFLLIASMTIGGYALGSYSAFDQFDVFSVFFALPWALWLIGLWWTATKTTTTTTTTSTTHSSLSLHRFLGNMLLKGCISVPISRLVGSLFQRIGSPFWSDVSGFYQGIGCVSFVVFIWQTVELYQFLQERRKEEEKTRNLQPNQSHQRIN